MLKDEPDLLEEFSNFLPEMMHEHERHRGALRSGPTGMPITSPAQNTSTPLKETPGVKREAPSTVTEAISPKLTKTGNGIREAISQATKGSPRPYTPSQSAPTVAGEKRKTSPNGPSTKKRVLSGIGS